jgi:hypothetical protein
MKRLLWSAFWALVVVISFGAGACGSSGGNDFNPAPGGRDDGGGGSSSGGMDAAMKPPSFLDGSSSDAPQTLVISPSTVTLPVTLGTTVNVPTQTFTTAFAGVAVPSSFTIDRGEIATINVSSGVLTPGALGGTATVTATYQGYTATASVTVKLTYVSDGDPNPPDAGPDASSAGGFGGVGGDGEGAAATPTQVATLNGTSLMADSNVTFLYPYDQTVFPQGILSPLLQWTPDPAVPFDAVYIHVVETYFEYKGYFQVQSGITSFKNHPLPQAAWTAIAYSNIGETVNVSLVFSHGTTAYGPVSETWKFAQGELKGTIYYQSYGTKLATNSSGALGPNPNFGGATLAIREGATSPVLVAGTNDTNPSGCRVCHSVASGGSVLITQQGGQPTTNDGTSSAYTLTSASPTENPLANNNGMGQLAWPGIYPDGTLLISNSGPLSGASTTNPSALYSTTDGSSIASTGLNGVGALNPAFSPDGTHMAYNFYGGPGADGGAAADQTSLAAMDFAVASKTFSNQRTLTTPTTGKAYWPSFLPTSDGVIYELETVSNGRDLAGTRGSDDIQNNASEDGAHGELWWLDLKTMTPTRLDTLNGLVTSTGLPYLPTHATAVNPTTADVTLNYEPTVNPVPSGGYAWVVFTSRRLYGNVATINPYWSDPRNEDLSSTPTPKKLWVAAIDLNPTPGTDPSHPAFYLPAQELLAGNARGFWVVDPCRVNGTSCVTGDECCGGFCRPSEDGGALMCSATQPMCSQEYEKCTTTADCCNSGGSDLQCIGGFCSIPSPK